MTKQHQYHQSIELPYAAMDIYALVIDIISYPEFLPWCVAARIDEVKSESELIATLLIRFKAFKESYSSRVTHYAPGTSNTKQGEGEISVEAISGPFSLLRNHWRMVPLEQGCRLEFSIAFEFKSALLNSLVGGMFERAQEKMIAAFTERAHQLYGH